jgi:flagellar hook-basal body complex protein FliE
MDVRSSIAAQHYTASRPATAPDPEAGQGGGNLGQLLKDFAAVLESGDQTAQAALTGRADSHALVTALSQTELAVEAAVTVRDKVVEAYQEILRMPV